MDPFFSTHLWKRRVCALLVIISFLWSDTGGYANSLGLPAALTGAAPSPVSIPESIGRMDGFFPAPSTKTILYIQDAHDSLEAQESIAKLIQHLVERRGVRTVFEEGYEGEVPTDKYFQHIQDPALREKVAYFLMDHLRLSGSEYAHILRKKDVRRGTWDEKTISNVPLLTPYFQHPTSDFRLVGADSLKFHRDNIFWYRDAARVRQSIEADLSELKRELQNLSARHFPSPFKAWMKLRERYTSETLGLLDYLKQTLSLLQLEPQAPGAYPKIKLLLFSEKSNDPKQIEVLKTLTGSDLWKEISDLEKEGVEKWLLTPRDRKIYQTLEALSLLDKVETITATSDEFKRSRDVLEHLKTDDLADFLARETRRPILLSKDWETKIQNAVQFYRTAHKRDDVMEQALADFKADPDQKLAVLVFGGFHKDAVLAALRKQGITCQSILPMITHTSERHQQFYKKLMRWGTYAFEQSRAQSAERKAKSKTPNDAMRYALSAMQSNVSNTAARAWSSLARWESMPSAVARSEIRRLELAAQQTSAPIAGRAGYSRAETRVSPVRSATDRRIMVREMERQVTSNQWPVTSVEKKSTGARETGTLAHSQIRSEVRTNQSDTFLIQPEIENIPLRPKVLGTESGDLRSLKLRRTSVQKRFAPSAGRAGFRAPAKGGMHSEMRGAIKQHKLRDGGGDSEEDVWTDIAPKKIQQPQKDLFLKYQWLLQSWFPSAVTRIEAGYTIILKTATDTMARVSTNLAAMATFAKKLLAKAPPTARYTRFASMPAVNFLLSLLKNIVFDFAISPVLMFGEAITYLIKNQYNYSLISIYISNVPRPALRSEMRSSAPQDTDISKPWKATGGLWDLETIKTKAQSLSQDIYSQNYWRLIASHQALSKEDRDQFDQWAKPRIFSKEALEAMSPKDEPWFQKKGLSQLLKEVRLLGILMRYHPAMEFWEELSGVPEGDDVDFESEMVALAHKYHFKMHGTSNDFIKPQHSLWREFNPFQIHQFMLSDRWALLAIMMDGAIKRGDWGTLGDHDSLDLGNLFENAWPYRPYYVVLDPSFHSANNREQSALSDSSQHRIYLVPGKSDRTFLEKALELSLARKWISESRYQEAMSKIATYEELTKIEPHLPAVLSGKMTPAQALSLVVQYHAAPIAAVQGDDVQQRSEIRGNNLNHIAYKLYGSSGAEVWSKNNLDNRRWKFKGRLPTANLQPLTSHSFRAEVRSEMRSNTQGEVYKADVVRRIFQHPDYGPMFIQALESNDPIPGDNLWKKLLPLEKEVLWDFFDLHSKGLEPSFELWGKNHEMSEGSVQRYYRHAVFKAFHNFHLFFPRLRAQDFQWKGRESQKDALLFIFQNKPGFLKQVDPHGHTLRYEVHWEGQRLGTAALRSSDFTIYSTTADLQSPLHYELQTMLRHELKRFIGRKDDGSDFQMVLDPKAEAASLVPLQEVTALLPPASPASAKKPWAERVLRSLARRGMEVTEKPIFQGRKWHSNEVGALWSYDQGKYKVQIYKGPHVSYETMARYLIYSTLPSAMTQPFKSFLPATGALYSPTTAKTDPDWKRILAIVPPGNHYAFFTTVSDGTGREIQIRRSKKYDWQPSTLIFMQSQSAPALVLATIVLRTQRSQNPEPFFVDAVPKIHTGDASVRVRKTELNESTSSQSGPKDRRTSRSEMRSTPKEPLAALRKLYEEIKDPALRRSLDFKTQIEWRDYILKRLHEKTGVAFQPRKLEKHRSAMVRRFYGGMLRFVWGKMLFEKHQKHLEKLMPRIRQILTLRYQEGHSWQQVRKTVYPKSHPGHGGVLTERVAPQLNHLRTFDDSRYKLLYRSQNLWRKAVQAGISTSSGGGAMDAKQPLDDKTRLEVLKLYAPQDAIGLEPDLIAEKTGLSSGVIHQILQDAETRIKELKYGPDEIAWARAHEAYGKYLVPSQWELIKKVYFGGSAADPTSITRDTISSYKMALEHMKDYAEEGTPYRMIETPGNHVKETLERLYPNWKQREGLSVPLVIDRLFTSASKDKAVSSEADIAKEFETSREQIRQYKNIGLWELAWEWNYPLRLFEEKEKGIQKSLIRALHKLFKKHQKIPSLFIVKQEIAHGFSNTTTLGAYLLFSLSDILRRLESEDLPAAGNPENSFLKNPDFKTAVRDFYERLKEGVESRKQGEDQHVRKMALWTLDDVLRQSYKDNGKIPAYGVLAEHPRIRMVRSAMARYMTAYGPRLVEKYQASEPEFSRALQERLSKRSFVRTKREGPALSETAKPLFANGRLHDHQKVRGTRKKALRAEPVRQPEIQTELKTQPQDPKPLLTLYDNIRTHFGMGAFTLRQYAKKTGALESQHLQKLMALGVLERYPDGIGISQTRRILNRAQTVSDPAYHLKKFPDAATEKRYLRALDPGNPILDFPKERLSPSRSEVRSSFKDAFITWLKVVHSGGFAPINDALDKKFGKTKSNPRKIFGQIIDQFLISLVVEKKIHSADLRQIILEGIPFAVWTTSENKAETFAHYLEKLGGLVTKLSNEGVALDTLEPPFGAWARWAILAPTDDFEIHRKPDGKMGFQYRSEMRSFSKNTQGDSSHIAYPPNSVGRIRPSARPKADTLYSLSSNAVRPSHRSEVRSDSIKSVHGVFKGGGSRLLAALGAVEVAWESGIRFDVSVAATSGGAMIAGPLAVGYTPAEIREEMLNFKFENIQDSFFQRLKNLASGGLHRTDKLEAWIRDLIRKKNPEARDITLKELSIPFSAIITLRHPKTKERKAYILDRENAPDLPLYLAMTLTQTLTPFFVPRVVTESLAKFLKNVPEGMLIEDGIWAGALGCGFPLLLYNDPMHRKGKPVWGFSTTPDASQPMDLRTRRDKFQYRVILPILKWIPGIRSKIRQFLHALDGQDQEIQEAFSQGKEDKLIEIPVSVGSLQLGLTPVQKLDLIRSGWKVMRKKLAENQSPLKFQGSTKPPAFAVRSELRSHSESFLAERRLQGDMEHLKKLIEQMSSSSQRLEQLRQKFIQAVDAVASRDPSVAHQAVMEDLGSFWASEDTERELPKVRTLYYESLQMLVQWVQDLETGIFRSRASSVDIAAPAKPQAIIARKGSYFLLKEGRYDEMTADFKEFIDQAIQRLKSGNKQETERDYWHFRGQVMVIADHFAQKEQLGKEQYQGYIESIYKATLRYMKAWPADYFKRDFAKPEAALSKLSIALRCFNLYDETIQLLDFFTSKNKFPLQPSLSLQLAVAHDNLANQRVRSHPAVHDEHYRQAAGHYAHWLSSTVEDEHFLKVVEVICKIVVLKLIESVKNRQDPAAARRAEKTLLELAASMESFQVRISEVKNQKEKIEDLLASGIIRVANYLNRSEQYQKAYDAAQAALSYHPQKLTQAHGLFQSAVAILHLEGHEGLGKAEGLLRDIEALRSDFDLATLKHEIELAVKTPQRPILVAAPAVPDPTRNKAYLDLRSKILKFHWHVQQKIIPDDDVINTATQLQEEVTAAKFAGEQTTKLQDLIWQDSAVVEIPEVIKSRSEMRNQSEPVNRFASAPGSTSQLNVPVADSLTRQTNGGQAGIRAHSKRSEVRSSKPLTVEQEKWLKKRAGLYAEKLHELLQDTSKAIRENDKAAFTQSIESLKRLSDLLRRYGLASSVSIYDVNNPMTALETMGEIGNDLRKDKTSKEQMLDHLRMYHRLLIRYFKSRKPTKFYLRTYYNDNKKPYQKRFVALPFTLRELQRLVKYKTSKNDPAEVARYLEAYAELGFGPVDLAPRSEVRSGELEVVDEYQAMQDEIAQSVRNLSHARRRADYFTSSLMDDESFQQLQDLMDFQEALRRFWERSDEGGKRQLLHALRKVRMADEGVQRRPTPESEHKSKVVTHQLFSLLGLVRSEMRLLPVVMRSPSNNAWRYRSEVRSQKFFDLNRREFLSLLARASGLLVNSGTVLAELARAETALPPVPLLSNEAKNIFPVAARAGLDPHNFFFSSLASTSPYIQASAARLEAGREPDPQWISFLHERMEKILPELEKSVQSAEKITQDLQDPAQKTQALAPIRQALQGYATALEEGGPMFDGDPNKVAVQELMDAPDDALSPLTLEEVKDRVKTWKAYTDNIVQAAHDVLAKMEALAKASKSPAPEDPQTSLRNSSQEALSKVSSDHPAKHIEEKSPESAGEISFEENPYQVQSPETLAELIRIAKTEGAVFIYALSGSGKTHGFRAAAKQPDAPVVFYTAFTAGRTVPGLMNQMARNLKLPAGSTASEQEFAQVLKNHLKGRVLVIDECGELISSSFGTAAFLDKLITDYGIPIIFSHPAKFAYLKGYEGTLRKVFRKAVRFLALTLPDQNNYQDLYTAFMDGVIRFPKKLAQERQVEVSDADWNAIREGVLEKRVLVFDITGGHAAGTYSFLDLLLGAGGLVDEEIKVKRDPLPTVQNLLGKIQNASELMAWRNQWFADHNIYGDTTGEFEDIFYDVRAQDPLFQVFSRFGDPVPVATIRSWPVSEQKIVQDFIQVGLLTLDQGHIRLRMRVFRPGSWQHFVSTHGRSEVRHSNAEFEMRGAESDGSSISKFAFQNLKSEIAEHSEVRDDKRAERSPLNTSSQDQPLNVRRNSEQERTGIPLNEPRIKRSLSPVTRESAFPARAAARRKSSSGSLETDFSKGSGVTSSVSSRIQASSSRISALSKLNLGRWSTSVNSAIWAGDMISRILPLRIKSWTAAREGEPRRMETKRFVSRTIFGTAITFLPDFLYDIRNFLIRDRVRFETARHFFRQAVPSLLPGFFLEAFKDPHLLKAVQFLQQNPDTGQRIGFFRFHFLEDPFRANHISAWGINQERILTPQRRVGESGNTESKKSAAPQSEFHTSNWNRSEMRQNVGSEDVGGRRQTQVRPTSHGLRPTVSSSRAEVRNTPSLPELASAHPDERFADVKKQLLSLLKTQGEKTASDLLGSLFRVSRSISPSVILSAAKDLRPQILLRQRSLADQNDKLVKRLADDPEFQDAVWAHFMESQKDDVRHAAQLFGWFVSFMMRPDAKKKGGTKIKNWIPQLVTRLKDKTVGSAIARELMQDEWRFSTLTQLVEIDSQPFTDPELLTLLADRALIYAVSMDQYIAPAWTVLARIKKQEEVGGRVFPRKTMNRLKRGLEDFYKTREEDLRRFFRGNMPHAESETFGFIESVKSFRSAASAQPGEPPRPSSTGRAEARRMDKLSVIGDQSSVNPGHSKRLIADPLSPITPLGRSEMRNGITVREFLTRGLSAVGGAVAGPHLVSAELDAGIRISEEEAQALSELFHFFQQAMRELKPLDKFPPLKLQQLMATAKTLATTLGPENQLTQLIAGQQFSFLSSVESAVASSVSDPDSLDLSSSRRLAVRAYQRILKEPEHFDLWFQMEKSRPYLKHTLGAWDAEAEFKTAVQAGMNVADWKKSLAGRLQSAWQSDMDQAIEEWFGWDGFEVPSDLRPQVLMNTEEKLWNTVDAGGSSLSVSNSMSNFVRLKSEPFRRQFAETALAQLRQELQRDFGPDAHLLGGIQEVDFTRGGIKGRLEEIRRRSRLVSKGEQVERLFQEWVHTQKERGVKIPAKIFIEHRGKTHFEDDLMKMSASQYGHSLDQRLTELAAQDPEPSPPSLSQFLDLLSEHLRQGSVTVRFFVDASGLLRGIRWREASRHLHTIRLSDAVAHYTDFKKLKFPVTENKPASIQNPDSDRTFQYHVKIPKGMTAQALLTALLRIQWSQAREKKSIFSLNISKPREMEQNQNVQNVPVTPTNAEFPAYGRDLASPLSAGFRPPAERGGGGVRNVELEQTTIPQSEIQNPQSETGGRRPTRSEMRGNEPGTFARLPMRQGRGTAIQFLHFGGDPQRGQARVSTVIKRRPSSRISFFRFSSAPAILVSSPATLVSRPVTLSSKADTLLSRRAMSLLFFETASSSLETLKSMALARTSSISSRRVFPWTATSSFSMRLSRPRWPSAMTLISLWMPSSMVPTSVGVYPSFWDAAGTFVFFFMMELLFSITIFENLQSAQVRFSPVILFFISILFLEGVRTLRLDSRPVNQKLEDRNRKLDERSSSSNIQLLTSDLQPLTSRSTQKTPGTDSQQDAVGRLQMADSSKQNAVSSRRNAVQNSRSELRGQMPEKMDAMMDQILEQWKGLEPALGKVIQHSLSTAILFVTIPFTDDLDLSQFQVSGLGGQTSRPILARVRESDMRIILTHLFSNALHAMAERKTKKLIIEAGQGEKGDFIRVTDTGHGIAQKDRDRIWELSFSKKPAGIEGTGLGLPTIKELADKNRIQIQMESQVGKGTSFTLWFPRSEMRYNRLQIADSRQQTAVSRKQKKANNVLPAAYGLLPTTHSVHSMVRQAHHHPERSRGAQYSVPSLKQVAIVNFEDVRKNSSNVQLMELFYLARKGPKGLRILVTNTDRTDPLGQLFYEQAARSEMRLIVTSSEPHILYDIWFKNSTANSARGHVSEFQDIEPRVLRALRNFQGEVIELSSENRHPDPSLEGEGSSAKRSFGRLTLPQDDDLTLSRGTVPGLLRIRQSGERAGTLSQAIKDAERLRRGEEWRPIYFARDGQDRFYVTDEAGILTGWETKFSNALAFSRAA